MASFIIFLALVVAQTSIYKVKCTGQFFQITKDNGPMNKEDPFLTADVFQCSREKSCTTLHNTKSTGGGTESSSDAYSITKMKDPSTKYPSCATALRLNDNIEGYYKIHQGNMEDLIEVECKVIDGITYAIIHHDSEKTELVDGYESAGSFKREFKYVIDLEDVKLFVDSSSSCRQLTRLDCHGSNIHYKGNTISYLVDRNSIQMPYVGGGPINGEGCECSITYSCAKPGTTCNCDINDNVWRYDNGFVTEKGRLPLTAVRIGDTGGSSEMMRYTIGPLLCKSEV